MERTHRLIVTEIIALLYVILRKTKIYSTLYPLYMLNKVLSNTCVLNQYY